MFNDPLTVYHQMVCSLHSGTCVYHYEGWPLIPLQAGLNTHVLGTWLDNKTCVIHRNNASFSIGDGVNAISAKPSQIYTMGASTKNLGRVRPLATLTPRSRSEVTFSKKLVNAITPVRSHIGFSNSYHGCIYQKSWRNMNLSNLDT